MLWLGLIRLVKKRAQIVHLQICPVQLAEAVYHAGDKAGKGGHRSKIEHKIGNANPPARYSADQQPINHAIPHQKDGRVHRTRTKIAVLDLANQRAALPNQPIAQTAEPAAHPVQADVLTERHASARIDHIPQLAFYLRLIVAAAVFVNLGAPHGQQAEQRKPGEKQNEKRAERRQDTGIEEKTQDVHRNIPAGDQHDRRAGKIPKVNRIPGALVLCLPCLAFDHPVITAQRLVQQPQLKISAHVVIQHILAARNRRRNPHAEGCEQSEAAQ